MYRLENPIGVPVESKTYPLGEKTEHSRNGQAHALVALSHSTVEHRLYSSMLAETNEKLLNSFTARRLMILTGIRSLSTIRRGLEGLLSKLSIERDQKPNGLGTREPGARYIALIPEQIIARRSELGIGSYEKGLGHEG